MDRGPTLVQCFDIGSFQSHYRLLCRSPGWLCKLQVYGRTHSHVVFWKEDFHSNSGLKDLRSCLTQQTVDRDFANYNHLQMRRQELERQSDYKQRLAHLSSGLEALKREDSEAIHRMTEEASAKDHWKLLLYAIRPPSDNEPKLKQVEELVEQAVYRAQHTLDRSVALAAESRAERTGRATAEQDAEQEQPASCSQAPWKGFVAVSYRWEPSEGECDKKEKPRIASKMEEQLKVRDIVLDRTSRFIRYKQARGVMLPLLFDELSIVQKKTSERETAMQSMDVVYKKCAYAVGYLWTQLQSQTEMNRLSDLLSGRIVERKLVEGNLLLIKGINKEIVREVLDVLKIITDDVWWTRTWIFQEDYLAGKRMWLMIRHACGLRKPLVHNKLGLLQGKAIVRPDELKTYATLFCLACRNAIRKDSIIIKQSTKISEKVAKYNILCKYQSTAVNAEESMTTRILKDLDGRESKVRTNLLPIVAIVCAYDVRL
ncbi:hypothetical protein EK21DRAFT_94781 [Setomelanomma holmii]|uniref:Heterokaryon incompatibility domain-containing protein n=1 Tax=Setomelanomma holmii TaxID=210430 RepID=A0A9P4GVD1_9PLEO|nr:hypothetical protein EK21DRAFT_94781 [Setomelanomma holmii]